MTKYSALLADIATELESIKLIHPFPTDVKKLADPYEFEYLLSVNKLLVLREFCNLNKALELSKAGLDAFLKFYDERFARTEQTDASAFIGYDLPAEKLSRRISLVLQRHYKTDRTATLAMRFPGLQINPSIRGSVENMRPHRWFMSEKKCTVIIYDCLEQARKSGKYEASFPLNQALTPTDIAFLKMHSPVVKSYIDSFVTQDEAYKEKIRLTLYNALKGTDFKLTASFGEVGLQRLKAHCAADFMRDICLLPDWKLLLQAVPDEFLRAGILKAEKSIDSIAVVDLGDDENKARISLIEISEVYRRELKARTTEYDGPTLMGLGMGVSRTEKLDAVDHFIDFLRSGKPLNQFPQYIIDNKLEKFLPAYNDSRLLWNSTLCHIVTLARTWTPGAVMNNTNQLPMQAISHLK